MLTVAAAHIRTSVTSGSLAGSHFWGGNKRYWTVRSGTFFVAKFHSLRN